MKCIGILTENFALYHDLILAMKRMDIPFISLSYNEEIPSSVGVIVTSREEAENIQFPDVVYGDDVEEIIARAQCHLLDKERYELLLVGIDPGERTGIAVVGDGVVLRKEVATSVDSAIRIVSKIISVYPHKKYLVKIGHGDVINRNRIINGLSRKKIRVVIVDESSTTKYSVHKNRREHRRFGPLSHHIDAAIAIAMSDVWREAKRRYSIEPTRGDIKEVQRRSRIVSEGSLTISEDLARDVIEGKISMEDAIEKQRKKEKLGNER
ncbi:MAG: hypothetical protein DRN20_01510 [Thermoplasmata archaeon]|nr:MAG: hypothetical protein DRN20_01510 [Thermoplasmata archaeon]